MDVIKKIELVEYDVLSIKKEKFGDCDVNDCFFDSLKADYSGFEKWFKEKVDNEVYIHRDDSNTIQGFLFLKEEGENEDYSHFAKPLEPKKRMKIGTFKISENGFYMGERFFKIIFENAIKNIICLRFM
jgi:hypothetical protein